MTKAMTGHLLVWGYLSTACEYLEVVEKGLPLPGKPLTGTFLQDQGLHLGQISLPLQELLSAETRQGPQPVGSAVPWGEYQTEKK